MAEKKNSLILYTDYLEQIELLNNEQRGVLLTSLLMLQNGDELPKMDPLTELAFSFISADVRRNNEKYQAIVEKRRAAGRKGGKQTQANQANANDNDNVNDNDKDNVNDNDSVSVKKRLDQVPPAQTHSIPSLDEIKAYCIERKNGLDASKFYEYYQMRDWKLSGGGPMKDWKAAVRYWETREKKDKSTKFTNFEERPERDWNAIQAEMIRKSMNL